MSTNYRFALVSNHTPILYDRVFDLEYIIAPDVEQRVVFAFRSEEGEEVVTS